MRERKYLFIVILAFALSGPSFLAHAADVGRPAPQLMAKELDGTAFDLDTLRGKVIIVHFWATWCPSCREEMPALDSFYRQYHAKGVEVIAVSAEKPRKRDDVTETMKPFAFPAAMLDDVTQNGFGKPESLPVTYIIGPDGVVRQKLTPETGILTTEMLIADVAPLLNIR